MILRKKTTVARRTLNSRLHRKRRSAQTQALRAQNWHQKSMSATFNEWQSVSGARWTACPREKVTIWAQLTGTQTLISSCNLPKHSNRAPKAILQENRTIEGIYCRYHKLSRIARYRVIAQTCPLSNSSQPTKRHPTSFPLRSNTKPFQIWLLKTRHKGWENGPDCIPRKLAEKTIGRESSRGSMLWMIRLRHLVWIKRKTLETSIMLRRISCLWFVSLWKLFLPPNLPWNWLTLAQEKSPNNP